LLPSLFGAVEKSWGWQAPGQFLASVGILQMIIGLFYFAVALGLCSEYSFIVLTRRELAAFFYSPMAYFVLFFSAMIAALQFGIFVSLTVVERPEPIIISLVWPLSIFSLLLIVPLLTMRLFSEEQRSGTMEMLQTAPVTDGSVVLSKFVATLIVFMMAWVPYGLFMIALRMEGGQPFDYRPIVSFAVALLCSGGGFVAMGLFYSSLTRNQLVAGVLSAVSMLFLLAPALIEAGQGAWASLLSYISFVDLWRTTLLGKLALKDLAYHISATVVWLFLTMKVLESRKWR
jgi:ABC-2 type transport system permease protein